MKWHKTNTRGVRYREHPTRKHGVRLDRYFSIRYKVNGVSHEEGIGWSSEKWTEQSVGLLLADLKKAHVSGEGPVTLAEKRKLEQERREKEKAEVELLERQNITFGDFFNDTYSPVAKVSKKAGSYQNEQDHFNLWLQPIIGDLPFKDISPFHLEKVKKKMLDAEKAPRTVQYCLATFRQVWNAAVTANLAQGDSPSKKVKIAKFDNRRLRFLTQEEADLLLKDLASRSSQLHDVALLSLHCGLRLGEITFLTWGDVDIASEMLVLRDSKSGKTRTAHMTQEVKAMLKKRKEGKQEELVFKSRKDGKIKTASRSFDRAVEDLKLNDGVLDRRQRVCFHTLRHTFASWHVMAGTDIRVLQELLGHQSIEMVMRYSHLGQNALKTATKHFEKALSGQKGKVLKLESKIEDSK